MRSNPDLDALVRKAQESGAKVLGVKLPDAGPVAVTRANAHVDGPLRQEFVVHAWRPPSLNRLMRGKIRDRIRLGKEAKDRVRWACHGASIYHAHEVKRRVSVVVTYSGRQRPTDPDNLWKALLDALKQAGAIVDDSSKWVELGSVSFTRGETTSTRIILEDI